MKFQKVGLANVSAVPEEIREALCPAEGLGFFSFTPHVIPTAILPNTQRGSSPFYQFRCAIVSLGLYSIDWVCCSLPSCQYFCIEGESLYQE